MAVALLILSTLPALARLGRPYTRGIYFHPINADESLLVRSVTFSPRYNGQPTIF